jgi:Cullin family
MIGKLKLKCGSQFTSKMEGMMNDLAIGVDHEKEFAEHYKKRQAADGIRGGMEFSVQVCVTRQHGDTHFLAVSTLYTCSCACVYPTCLDTLYTVLLRPACSVPLS